MGSVKRVLAYGDSLTAGYHQHGMAFHPYANRLSAKIGSKVEHVGLSGWTIEKMIQHSDWPACTDVTSRTWPGLAFELDRAKDEDKSYTHVVLLGGTNDMCHSSPETIVQGLHQWHQIAWDRGAKTLALTVPGLAVERTMRQVTQGRHIVNEGIRQMVSSYTDNAFLVEIDAAVPHLELDENERYQLWESDGLHMTPEGYDRIADAVASKLNSI